MMIIKIGGGKAINLQGIVADLAQLEEPFIIVHGANAVRDELAEKLGKPKQVVTSVSGYSSVLTDTDAMDVFMMAYPGLQNTRLVELCQQHGINALGLSGLDGRLIQGKRNVGIRVEQNGKKMILRDYSGKPYEINVQLLRLLLDNEYVPVICPPILDEEGTAINTENDDIVRLLQQVMGAQRIIFLIEAPGFLADKEDPTTLVEQMTPQELAERESHVEGRMKRKMLALRKLFEAGATQVIISDGRVEHPLQEALQGKGTVIQ